MLKKNAEPLTWMWNDKCYYIRGGVCLYIYGEAAAVLLLLLPQVTQPRHTV